jgi:hypothetical protein
LRVTREIAELELARGWLMLQMRDMTPRKMVEAARALSHQPLS